MLLAATATTFVGQWHSQYTGIYRKAAQVPCESSLDPPSFSLFNTSPSDNPSPNRGTLDPNAYATHAEAKENPAKHKFNCAQRAHANFLEHQTQLLIPMLISGLRYPVFSAALGAAWCIARVMYGFGYVKGATPRGRFAGTWFHISEYVLAGTAAYTSWQLLSG